MITATFNRAATVAEAVESVKNQTHREMEHLVIDGASSDDTVAEVRRVAEDRLTLVSEPDQGIYDALNKGIALASGDVIGLLHSDDVFAAPDVLERVAEAFADPRVQGVYGDLEYVSSSDPDRVIRYWRAGAYAPGKLRRGWMPPHPTLYLRREVLAEWGGYDTRYRIAADYDAMLRWLLQGRIRLAYIPRVLVRMRVGGASNRSLRQILRKSLEDYRALRANGAGGLWTLLLKNLRKIGQFFVRS